MSESALDKLQPCGATAIKDTLLAGTATFKEIAEALGVTERTVYRMDLPYVIVAGKRRAPLDLAREQIMSRIRGGPPPPPRGRGRPRNVERSAHSTSRIAVTNYK